jgi:hypothetical protein
MLGIRCPNCGGVWHVPERPGSTRGVCCGCGQPVDLARAPTVAILGVKPPTTARPAVPPAAEATLDAIVVEDDAETTTAEAEAQASLDAIVVEDEAEPRPRRRRKGKPPPRRRGLLIPTWVQWLAGLMIFVAEAIVAGAIVVRAGYAAELFVFGIAVAVMVPISTAILIASMFISSYITGGIDFGDARTTIPKAMMLILVANLIGMVPFGQFVALPVWVLGLMWLFDLDFWETRLLVAVNWALNWGAKIVVILVVVSALHKDGDEAPEKDEPPGTAPSTLTVPHRPAWQ